MMFDGFFQIHMKSIYFLFDHIYTNYDNKWQKEKRKYIIIIYVYEFILYVS